MKPTPARTRILLALIMFSLFASLSLLFPAGGWVGGVCIDSPTEPRGDAMPMLAWTDYGFPAPLLRRLIVDCNPTPQWEIVWLGFTIDAAVFSIMGYGLNRLLSRRRPLPKASTRS